MRDDELHFWGQYGRSITAQNTLLQHPELPVDLIKAWNVIGALEEKVRKLEEERDV